MTKNFKLYSPDGDGGGESTPAPTPAATTGSESILAADAVVKAAPTPSLPADHWAMADTLPPDVRGNIAFKDYKTPADAHKSHLALASKLGNSVALPKDGAPAEEWDKFYTRLGRPEAADKYVLPEVKIDDKTVVKVIPAKAELFKKLAFANGLSEKQAAAVYQEYVKADFAEQDTAYKNYQAEQAKELAAYQKSKGEKWGETVDLSRLAVRNLGGDALKAVFKASGLGNNPVLVEALAKVGRMMSEDRAHGGQSFTAASDASSARSEIKQLREDAKFQGALTNKGDVGHDDAVKRWTHLHGLLGKNG